jgi:alpha-1,6-mannosyltransferase
LATFLGSFFFLTASQVNYPGGKAFRFLHDVTLGEQDMRRRVHIDVSSAMTGVSRFGEENIKWKYSKQEDLKTKDQLSTFDYLLTATNPKKLAPEFQLMQSFDVFERPDLNTLQVKTKKYIHVLRNSKTKEPTIINSSSK